MEFRLENLISTDQPCKHPGLCGFSFQSLLHSDPRQDLLSLNLTWSLIIRPNYTLKTPPPRETMSSQDFPVRYNFIYVTDIYFPTRSIMCFGLCCYIKILVRVSEKIHYSGQLLLTDQNDLWKPKSNFISLLPKTFQSTDFSLMAAKIIRETSS